MDSQWQTTELEYGCVRDGVHTEDCPWISADLFLHCCHVRTSLGFLLGWFSFIFRKLSSVHETGKTEIYWAVADKVDFWQIFRYDSWWNIDFPASTIVQSVSKTQLRKWRYKRLS